MIQDIYNTIKRGILYAAIPVIAFATTACGTTMVSKRSAQYVHPRCAAEVAQINPQELTDAQYEKFIYLAGECNKHAHELDYLESQVSVLENLLEQQNQQKEKVVKIELGQVQITTESAE